MVDHDTDCINVLTHVTAATKALKAHTLDLLDEHPSHCLTDAIRIGGEGVDAKIMGTSAAIARLVRS